MQPRDFSLYGAVDLGARQAAVQRRQQTAQSGQSGSGAAGSAGTGPDGTGPDGTGPDGGFVIDVTEQTFNTDVVERSRTTPVIMDLWAEWCGPCKQLSPILEKLATEAAGQWILAKVDVDANPQLSAALQVQSIPMVVAVIGGQLVDGFLGALPEAQVKQWIGQVMAAAAKMGLNVSEAAGAEAAEAAGAEAAEAVGAEAAGPAEAANGSAGPAAATAASAAGRPMAGAGADAAGQSLPPAFAEARDAMERGDFDAAAKAFEAELARSPADPVAKTGLAQVNLIRRINSYDEVAVRRDAAEHPADPGAQIKVADIDVASGRVEEAFDRLLGVVRRTAGEDRENARAHLVSLFDVFPPRDPRVSKARATLSALLF
jgi:putative thioredoxin